MSNMTVVCLIVFIVAFSYSAESCFPRRSRETVPSTSNRTNRILIRDHNFVDTFGRVRIFHGWNSVLKGFPWYDHQMLNDTRLDLLKSWGFNAVRLGTMWTGFEPTEGSYNQTYVNIMKTIVQKLRKRGIYALLDMHQDVISTKFDAYDGVPRWVIDSLPPEAHPYPWPLAHKPSGSGWFMGYLTEGVGHAFQCIYHNVANSAAKMGKFWQKVATEFRDTDTVLGYELINEPWAGDIYQNPNLLLPAEAGKLNLQGLYEQLNTAIRTVDNETIIFYEPTTWGVFIGNNKSYFGTGFQHVPGGKDYNDRSALSYHYYCWILTQNMSQPYPIWKSTVCNFLSGSVFDNVLQDVKKIGGGLMLTEFGTCTTDGNPNSTDTIECNRVMKEADDALQSWTYWDSEFFHGNGSVITNTVKGFSRPYARAVAGLPLEMSFDTKTAVFKFRYKLNVNIKAPTEIYISPLHYPKGGVVIVSKGMEWREDHVNNILYIKPSSGGILGDLVNVTITPAP